MRTLRRSPALRIAAGTQKTPNRVSVSPPAVPAERVREMLLEIAFVLHATRVVGRMDDGVAAEDGDGKISAESAG